MYSVCPYVAGITFAAETAAIQDNCLMWLVDLGREVGKQARREGDRIKQALTEPGSFGGFLNTNWAMSLPYVIIVNNFHLPHGKADLPKPGSQPTYLVSPHHNSSHMQLLIIFPNILLSYSFYLLAKSFHTGPFRSYHFLRRLSKLFLFQIEYLVSIARQAYTLRLYFTMYHTKS